MEKIRKKIKELFQVMGFDDIEIDIRKDNSLKDRELLIVNIDMDSKQANSFLGEGAVGLDALQHLARVSISREDIGQTLLLIDINKYRKKREDDLTELAAETAKKARRTKKPIALEPMSAYERRFVHLKLAEQSDIVTESIGDEPERKIVVRLYP